MISLSSSGKILIWCMFLSFNYASFAQKHDANWCFGLNTGISFANIDSISTFECITYSDQSSAAFSNKYGEFLFYVSYHSTPLPRRVDIRDSNHEIVPNGDYINTHYYVTSGPVILPSPANDSIFYIFYLSNFPQIPSDLCEVKCMYLSRTIVKMKSNGTLSIIEKNEIISQENFIGKMSAVQHANGKDWWLLLHCSRRKLNEPCNNTFYRFLITENGIHEPKVQNIGTLYCHGYDGLGEMIFSNKGNKLASAVRQTKVIDIFNFNRCSGELSDFQYLNILGNIVPYGLEFSPIEEYLYATTIKEEGGGSELYQYILKDIPTKQTIWSLLGVKETLMGQLKLAPDGKIYLAKAFPNSFPNDSLHFFNQTLGVIHSPDSAGLACDFDPYGFHLHDSTRAFGGLPNMPNYNLGSLNIFKGSAGGDTVTICSEVPHKGILIGSPEVQGVQYNWYPSAGLDDDTLAEPVALPEVSTWYYLTLTDTTITNACQSRTDSIFVEVKDCSDTLVSVMPYVDEEEFDYRLHPNLLKNELIANISLRADEQGFVEIYSLQGLQLGTYHISEGDNQLNLNRISTGSGIYFYRVRVNGEYKHSDKLIIMR